MDAGAEPVTPLNAVSASPVTNAYPYNFTAASYTGVLSQGICNDDMSDTQYGWGLSLIKPRASGGWDTLSGCCAFD